MAFAAWFGLLATALNLFPIGQLDGGHISYAVLGRYSTYVTLVTVAVALALTWFSTSWLVWTVLMVGMLITFGFAASAPVYDEDVPLDRARRLWALFAVVMFVLCFTPAPIELMESLKHRTVNDAPRSAHWSVFSVGRPSVSSRSFPLGPRGCDTRTLNQAAVAWRCKG